MKRKYCDLHTHTLYSDGTYTPRELMLEADRLGLSAVVLCDHNTVAGIPEFLQAARDTGVEAVAATELSTEYCGKELHIVGMFIEPEHFDKITALVEDMQAEKEKSYRSLVTALSADGYHIDYDEIVRSSGDGRINRAHIAEALMKHGYVESISAAFKSLLSKDGGYYREPRYIPTLSAISFLKSIGAVVVLAHPYLSLDEGELYRLLPEAKAAGLDGMETVYSKYSEETAKAAKKLADEFGLLESGGSDFHGERKPDIALGTGRGNLRVPTEFFELLKKRRDEIRSK